MTRIPKVIVFSLDKLHSTIKVWTRHQNFLAPLFVCRWLYMSNLYSVPPAQQEGHRNHFRPFYDIVLILVRYTSNNESTVKYIHYCYFF
jgi:hypothetical protein